MTLRTSSYVEKYKRALKEASGTQEKEEEPLEMPIADYKTASEEIIDENNKLKNEIAELEEKIRAEEDKCNEELDQLMEENRKIVDNHTSQKAELDAKYKSINRKINDLEEWFADKEAIDKDLEDAQSEEAVIEQEKAIMMKILDDFIKITKTIGEGNADFSYLTSHFTSDSKKVKSVKNFRQNIETLKKAMIKRAYQNTNFDF